MCQVSGMMISTAILTPPSSSQMGVPEVPRLALPEHQHPGGHPRLHRGRCHIAQALQKVSSVEERRQNHGSTDRNV